MASEEDLGGPLLLLTHAHTHTHTHCRQAEGSEKATVDMAWGAIKMSRLLKEIIRRERTGIGF